MATLHERIARARDALVSAGIDLPEAVLDAQLLARHVLGWDRAQLLTRGQEQASASFHKNYEQAIARRCTREPVAQIVGRQEFWSLDFEVTPDVLIPRPETELILEEALAVYAERHPNSIVDVGTGSGCLAIALALEFPRADITATDVSMAALDIARRNAKRHGVDHRIAFVQTDLLPHANAVDLMVSNPPYVAERDRASLAPEVRDYEPSLALFAGEDGLSVYRRLLPEARQNISSPDVSLARLIIEIGHDQKQAVTSLGTAAGFRLVHTRRDLQGITRVLVFEPDVTESKS
jgi:release factor glutamine methyltransferase